MAGSKIVDRMQARLAEIPGIYAETLIQAGGPAGAKPVHLRLIGQDFDALEAAVDQVRAKFADTAGLFDLEDTRPVPGIDWQINVDTEIAGRFGADVQTIGGMVQLVTRGLLLDTMRVDSSEEEIDIRVRLPEENRLLSTLETLRVQTNFGMVPLSNFITTETVASRVAHRPDGPETLFRREGRCARQPGAACRCRWQRGPRRDPCRNPSR